MNDNIFICQKCVHSGMPKSGKNLPCKVNGVPFIDNARTGNCPLQKFGTSPVVQLSAGQAVHGLMGKMKNAIGVGQAQAPVIAQRREICAACPHRVPSVERKVRTCCGGPTVSQTSVAEAGTPTEMGFCEKCSCPILAKTQLQNEACPAGKW